MKRAKLFSILAIALAAICIAPAARATDFNLNVNYCQCIPTSLGGIAGDVDVTSPGTNEVEIAVTIDSPLQFHGNGIDSFAFNVVGFSSLTSSNFTINNAGGSGWTFSVPAGTADGAGKFMYSFQCTAGSNGCSPAPVQTFDFTITATGLTVADVESTNGGASNVDFEASVADANINSCTGAVGGGDGTAQSTPTGTTTTACAGGTPSTPEASSIGFFGTGLLVVGWVLRRKLVTLW